MGTVFRLPDLGEGLQDAEIVRWYVGVGDHVVTDQPLLSIETDKAVVEVPSPQSGHIAALHAGPGDIVAVGAPLVEFGEAAPADKGAIVGEIDGVRESGRKDTGARVEPAKEAPAAAPTAPTRAIPGTRATPAVGAAREVRASPAVRRLAAELGVDLAAVGGTGIEGTITRADVEGAASTGSLRGTPVRGVRRAMLQNMTRAGREVVHAAVTNEADIDAWPDGVDVTVRLVRAIAEGVKASPSLNAWFHAATGTRTLHEHIDLGMAVETDDGLFVPVIRDAANQDSPALRTAIDTIKNAVAQRSIAREDMTGQTITLSNFGMFGGRYADLVVMPPQVAILGAGRAQARAVVVDGQIIAHKILPLSLTFDHRVVTGVEAARFLNAVIEDLQRAT